MHISRLLGLCVLAVSSACGDPVSPSRTPSPAPSPTTPVAISYSNRIDVETVSVQGTDRCLLVAAPGTVEQRFTELVVEGTRASFYPDPIESAPATGTLQAGHLEVTTTESETLSCAAGQTPYVHTTTASGTFTDANRLDVAGVQRWERPDGTLAVQIQQRWSGMLLKQ